MIAKGEPWGSPTTAPADHQVSGDDRALAAVVIDHPGALIAFTPDASSELARTVGLSREAHDDEPDHERDDERDAMDLPMDALVLGDGTLALNMVVLGTPPDRLSRFSKRVELQIRADGKIWFNDECTTVILAVGQWLHGVDLVPRGHPGDGRIEVQAYRLDAGERRRMRKRLPQGSHLPHPRIPNRTARTIEIEAVAPLPLEVDGETLAPVRRLRAEVRAGAYRLLV